MTSLEIHVHPPILLLPLNVMFQILNLIVYAADCKPCTGKALKSGNLEVIQITCWCICHILRQVLNWYTILNSCSFLAIAKMISIIIMVINLLNMFGIMNYLMTGYSGNSKFIVPLDTNRTYRYYYVYDMFYFSSQ
jgi:hypothetical protein